MDQDNTDNMVLSVAGVRAGKCWGFAGTWDPYRFILTDRDWDSERRKLPVWTGVPVDIYRATTYYGRQIRRILGQDFVVSYSNTAIT